MAKTNFYLEQFSERIGCFEILTVLIIQLNELGEFGFDWHVKVCLFVKTRDTYNFREYWKTAIIITTIFADITQTCDKREMEEIEVEEISGRAFRIVTIVKLQSFRAISENQ